MEMSGKGKLDCFTIKSFKSTSLSLLDCLYTTKEFKFFINKIGGCYGNTSKVLATCAH